jgi:hypothetical protein
MRWLILAVLAAGALMTAGCGGRGSAEGGGTGNGAGGLFKIGIPF